MLDRTESDFPSADCRSPLPVIARLRAGPPRVWAFPALLVLFSLLSAFGCSDPAASPIEAVEEDPPIETDAELEILFVGNSLTYYNDLPGLVETISEASGHPIKTTTVAKPNYSLEDHWRDGIGSTIADLEPDLVVMQQGPSSLPSSQAYLLNWTIAMDKLIREAGSEPALLMVWPEEARVGVFTDVRESYRNAALAVEGRFIPGGEAFFGAIAVRGLDPYGPDRFHPSRTGSILTALTVVRTLFPGALEDLPTKMVPSDSSNPTVDLGTSAGQILSIVEEAVSEYGI